MQVEVRIETKLHNHQTQKIPKKENIFKTQDMDFKKSYTITELSSDQLVNKQI